MKSAHGHSRNSPQGRGSKESCRARKVSTLREQGKLQGPEQQLALRCSQKRLSRPRRAAPLGDFSPAYHNLLRNHRHVPNSSVASSWLLHRSGYQRPSASKRLRHAWYGRVLQTLHARGFLSHTVALHVALSNTEKISIQRSLHVQFGAAFRAFRLSSNML